MKRLAAGGLIVLVIAVAAYVLFAKRESGPEFRTDRIVKGDIQTTVTATGTVNPVTTILVGTQVSGTIKEIYADFNSHVKKGQVIAVIDPATFEAQVDQSKATLLSAQANVEKADATLVDSKRTMNRNRELFSKNLIARSEVDTAVTNYEISLAQASTARSQAAQAEAALRLAETNLKYTKILSPVDGIVISRNVDTGQTVAASFQTPTLFNIAQDLAKMQIDTSIDEADIGRIKGGQDVEFTVDAFPDAVFKGKVWQVRNAPIIVQNVVTYDVVVRVDNQGLRLKPGMTANVSVLISAKKDVLKAPNAALRFRPSEAVKTRQQPKGPGVWIIENGKPKRVPVSTGISDGNYTEITSDVLKEGQGVITESVTKAKGPQSSGPRMF